MGSEDLQKKVLELLKDEEKKIKEKHKREKEELISEHEDECANIEFENDELKFENGELKSENGELKSENDELKSENEKLRRCEYEHECERAEKNQELAEMKKNWKKEKDHLENIINKIGPQCDGEIVEDEWYSIKNRLHDDFIIEKSQIQDKCAKSTQYDLSTEKDEQRLTDLLDSGALTNSKINTVHYEGKELTGIGYNKLLKVLGIPSPDYNINTKAVIKKIIEYKDYLCEDDRWLLGISITLRTDKDIEMGTIYISPGVI